MVSIEKRCRTRLRQALTVDLGNSSNGPNCFLDVINQKPGLTILYDLAARAEVHGNDWHPGGISFGQDEPESLRNSVQVQ